MAYTNGSSIKKVLIDGVLHPINDYRIEGTNFAVTQIAGDIAVGTPLTTEQLEHITEPVMSADGCVINAPALGTILIPKNVVFNPAATDDYVISYVSSPLEGKTYNLKITMDHTTGLPKEAVFAEEEVAAPPTNILKTKLDTYKTEFAKPVAERDPAIVAEAKVFGNDVLSKKPNIIVELDADNQPVEVFHATESPDPTAYYRYVNGKNECIDIYYDNSTDPYTTTDLAFPDLENIYVEKAKEYMEIHTTANTVVYKNTKPVMIDEDTLGFTQVEQATQGQGVDGIIHYPKSVLFTSDNAFTLKLTAHPMSMGQTTPAKIEASTDGLTDWAVAPQDSNMVAAFNPELGKYSLFVKADGPICSKPQYSAPKAFMFVTDSGDDIHIQGMAEALWGGSNPNTPGFANYLFCDIYGTSKFTDASELVFPDYTNEACYESMFSGAGLTKAPRILPAMNLTKSCYSGMFVGTKITNAVALPATQMAEYCYSGMYQNTNITVPMEFNKNTVLAKGCFSGMYQGSSITSLPALPFMNLKRECYMSMFKDCINITQIPSGYLPATDVTDPDPMETQDYVYANMFEGCTGITSLPENLLPAQFAGSSSYYEMFKGCTNLTAPISFTLTQGDCLGDSSMLGMFKGCGIVWSDTPTTHEFKVSVTSAYVSGNALNDMFANNAGSIPEGTGRPLTNKVYYFTGEAPQKQQFEFTWTDDLKNQFNQDPGIPVEWREASVDSSEISTVMPFLNDAWLNNATVGYQLKGHITSADGFDKDVTIDFASASSTVVSFKSMIDGIQLICVIDKFGSTYDVSFRYGNE